MSKHKSNKGFLIVTDLDGTLLDDTYDLQAAANAMDSFASLGSKVVPASSKTLAELHELNKHRANPSPLIFENGAGIAYPQASNHPDLPYQFDSKELQYSTLCELLDDLRTNLNLAFEGFHDLSDKAVARHTGLSPAAATLAKQRLFTEPLRWLGRSEDQQILSRHLREHALQLVAGGRFLHVMPMTDKGLAAAKLTCVLDDQYSTRRWRIACGDSDNDIPLFGWSDAFVLFPNRHDQYLDVREKSTVLATSSGPKEWVRTVGSLIRTLSEQQTDFSHE